MSFLLSQHSLLWLRKKSKNLLQWYINTIIVFVDIIHLPVFYLNHNVSETGFRVHLQKQVLSGTEQVELLVIPGEIVSSVVTVALGLMYGVIFNILS
jgi:hypothetical protein